MFMSAYIRKCNILILDPAVNQETGASGRSYRRYYLDLWTGWIRCTFNAHQKQEGVKKLYNRVPQTVRVSCSQLAVVRGWLSSVRGSEFQSLLEIRCRSESQRQTVGLGPQDPGWAAQQNEKEVLLKTEGLGVNMLQSVQSPSHLSHTTLSQPFRE